MEVCHFCGNKNFKKVSTEYSYRQEGKYLFIEDVPCEQCEYCGEQYFHAKVLTRIEREFENIYSNKKKVTRELVVPVESFAELNI